MEELDENSQIFVSEAIELLEEMEAALLDLENKHDDETLNLIFRAVHTIKGSAGLFGYEHIIEFTHVVENVLDDMRNCIIPITTGLITTMMRAKDQTLSLVEALPMEDDFDANEEQAIIHLLMALQNNCMEPDTELTAEIDEYSMLNDAIENPSQKTEIASSNITESTISQTKHYHISLRLGATTFQQGFNPIVMFAQLSNLGQIKSSNLISNAVPLLDKIDSELCYLGWEIALESHVKTEKIKDIYEFVEDVTFSIIPPNSPLILYKEMLDKLPAEDPKTLVKLLIQANSLTEEEVNIILSSESELTIKQNNNQENALTKHKDILVNQVLDLQNDDNEIKAKKDKKQSLNFVKVDSSKLDKLINLVGELVINGAKIEALSSKLNNDELTESLESLTVSMGELRETALAMQMMPIGSTFNRFHRVVRDVSNELEKNIQLEVKGAETELDKSVIEKIADPLMHLVRNSLDHGIEQPSERIQAGKSAEGLICLNARHEAGMIIIEISDDGQGLDSDVLVQKAIEKGIIKTGENLSKKEAFNLVFEAGFSTAETISNISGRGVGMDVVRRNIESLRGTVSLDSTIGLGTTVSIQLPLTLAIIDGFQVRVSQDDFIVPLDMVKECVTLNEMQMEETTIHDYITLRDEVLPLIKLTDYFSIDRVEKRKNRAPQDFDHDTNIEFRKKRKVNVIVVQFAQEKIGLVVDVLQGETQVVIKPLGRVFKGLDGFSGFTILGSGHIALIIDVPGLVKDVVATQNKNFRQYEQTIQVPTVLH